MPIHLLLSFLWTIQVSLGLITIVFAIPLYFNGGVLACSFVTRQETGWIITLFMFLTFLYRVFSNEKHHHQIIRDSDKVLDKFGM